MRARIAAKSSATRGRVTSPPQIFGRTPMGSGDLWIGEGRLGLTQPRAPEGVNASENERSHQLVSARQLPALSSPRSARGPAPATSPLFPDGSRRPRTQRLPAPP